MEEAIKTIESGLKLLAFTDKQTEAILERRKDRELERQVRTIQSSLDKIYDQKTKVIEEKFKADESEEEIEQWSGKFEEDVSRYDKSLEDLQATIASVKKAALQKSLQIEQQKEEERLQRVYEEKKRIETMKLDVRKQYEAKLDGKERRREKGLYEQSFRSWLSQSSKVHISIGFVSGVSFKLR